MSRLGALTLTLGALLVAAPALADPPAASKPVVKTRVVASTPATRLRDAREALMLWRLDDAAKLLKSSVSKAFHIEREVLRARLDFQRSRFAAVDKRLAPLVKKHPTAYEARVVLGRARLAVGDKLRALDALDPIATAYNDGRVTKARDLMWLGEAMRLSNYPHDAYDVLGEAMIADPTLIHAYLLTARLLVEKYDYQQADGVLDKIRAKRSGHPGVTLLDAVMDIESDRDHTKARGRAEALLKAAPQNVPAHNILARADLEQERPQDAIARLTKHSLVLAPNDLEALMLLGAAHALRDDVKAFAKVEKRALKVNPAFARFYSGVSEHVTRVHRYREALELNMKALKLDAADGRALANAAMGYSRVGDDAKATEFLERAHAEDGFNVRTFNLLDLFYDTRKPGSVIKQYEWVPAGRMKLRVHRSERAMLERYVPALLEEAYRFLAKKYRYEPKLPVNIEVFHDPQLFSIRSTGLPRLGAHGICFGHVVTARSPNTGDFNWAEVLWHELSHVFHIQLSDSRVPRWFTEGMAVYESSEGRPEWHREMNDRLLDYRRAGKLRGIAEFNLSFTQAQSLEDILVAYYHAFRVAAFIAEDFGFPKMRAMLVHWGKRKDTAEVFADVLGVDLKTFDERFFVWLDKDLAHIAKSFVPDTESYRADADKWVKAADAAPTDAAAQLKAALAELGRGALKAAHARVEKVLALDPAQPTARYIRGEGLLRKGDTKGAKADLEAVLAAGKDGYELRMLLAGITYRGGDKAAAVGHLVKAQAANPQKQAPYRRLISTLDELGRTKEAYTWRKKLVFVDEANATVLVALLDGAGKHGATKGEVLRWGEMAVHTAPFEPKVHVAFATQLERLGLKKRAAFERASAKLVASKEPPAAAPARTSPPK